MVAVLCPSVSPGHDCERLETILNSSKNLHVRVLAKLSTDNSCHSVTCPQSALAEEGEQNI